MPPALPLPPLPCDAIDLDRLRSATALAGIEHHPRLGSTNDRALELIAAGHESVPWLILADEQTAGRGRGANTWWAGSGALTFSLIVDGFAPRADAPQRAKISLAAGLAVCDALHTLLPNHGVRLKWPNDVFASGRKVCGILVEASATARHIVLGIGINANNSLEGAPSPLPCTATSIRDLLGRPIDRTDLLADAIRRTGEELAALSEDIDLRPRWSERCLLTGQIVQITHSAGSSRELVGLCRGIDSDGALLLHTEAGPQRIISGVAVRIDGADQGV